jgi:hypothetical protein
MQMRMSCALGVVVVVVAATACLESHDGAHRTVTIDNCVACHTTEYAATTAPVHPAAGCPTTCGDCHTTTAWTPNAAGMTPVAACGAHPEARFPVAAGRHANVACTTCHQVASAASPVRGGNTDCTSCHTKPAIDPSHAGVTGYAYGACATSAAFPCTAKNFCLACHPAGTASAHPTNLFPLPHGGSTCAQCHDESSGLPDAGGANVLCVTSGCHSNAHVHDTSHHPSCLASGCHPSGRSGG